MNNFNHFTVLMVLKFLFMEYTFLKNSQNYHSAEGPIAVQGYVRAAHLNFKLKKIKGFAALN